MIKESLKKVKDNPSLNDIWKYTGISDARDRTIHNILFKEIEHPLVKGGLIPLPRRKTRGQALAKDVTCLWDRKVWSSHPHSSQ